MAVMGAAVVEGVTEDDVVKGGFEALDGVAEAGGVVGEAATVVDGDVEGTVVAGVVADVADGAATPQALSRSMRAASNTAAIPGIPATFKLAPFNRRSHSRGRILRHYYGGGAQGLSTWNSM